MFNAVRMLSIRLHFLQLLAVVIILAGRSENVIRGDEHGFDNYSNYSDTTTFHGSSSGINAEDSTTQKSIISGNADVSSEIYHEKDGPASNTLESSIRSVLSNIENRMQEFLYQTIYFVPENRCQADFKLAINSAKAKELWALQFFDSWGKPSNSFMKFDLSTVGRYDQCRGVVSSSQTGNGTDSYKGEYCVVTILPVLDRWVKNRVAFQFGTCMPNTCSESDITQLANIALKELHISENVTANSTECRNDDREVTSATVVSLVLITIVGFLIFLGTVLDIVFVQLPKWVVSSNKVEQLPTESGNIETGVNSCRSELQESKDNGETDQCKSTQLSINEGKLNATNGEAQIYSNGEKDALIQKKNQNWIEGVPAKILLAFSAYTNWTNLFNTNHRHGPTAAINGIRVITMMWIFVLHLQIAGYRIGSFTTNWAMHVYSTRMLDYVTNGSYSVDTFFVISGLLTSYNLYKEVLANGWKMNWKKVLFHRYWRLTPPYMAVMLLILGLQRFMGSGAMWATTQPFFQSECESNWWRHLLYVNNFIDTVDSCGVHFWYLAVDMQLFLLTPILLIPFYYNKYAGLGTCGFFLALNWIISGVLSAQNKWGISLSQYFTSFVFPNESVYTLSEFNTYFNHYYQASYCRAAPFIVGIVAGHFLAEHKGHIPLRWDVSILGWITALASGGAVIYGVHDDLARATLSISTAAFYNTVSRTVWALCVLWVIIACASGRGGPVQAVLSWSPFIVFGRITYMLYLIQMSVFDVYFGNMEQIITLTSANLLIMTMGLVLVSGAVSVALTLAFESPFIKLEKVLF